MFCEVYEGAVISGPAKHMTASKGVLMPAEIVFEDLLPLKQIHGPAVFDVLEDKVIVRFPAVDVTDTELLVLQKPIFKQKVNSWRKDAEVAGFIHNGVTYSSTREHQTDMANRIKEAFVNPDDTFPIYKKSGEVVRVDAETLKAICLSGLEHVQYCFSRQRALDESIDAATTVEELEELSW